MLPATVNLVYRLVASHPLYGWQFIHQIIQKTVLTHKSKDKPKSPKGTGGGFPYTFK